MTNDLYVQMFCEAMNDVAERPYTIEQARACWETMHADERDEWIAQFDSALADKVQ